jgi:prepilin signal peptidase PulO-like enzyme (type II secretory pathway)
MNLLWPIIAGLLGLLAGGAVNWLADDLPYTFRLSQPHYPNGVTRPLLAWLGILAFALRRRQAPADSLSPYPAEPSPEALALGIPPRPTSPRLPWRHPITELILALLSAHTVVQFGFTPRALYLMGCVFALALIAVIDLEHRMILIVVILLACLYTLIGTALVTPFPKIGFSDHVLGGVMGFILFLLMYLGGMFFSAIAAALRGEQLSEVAFGYGDVLLAALSGLILGWQAFLFAVTIAVFAGGAGALIYIFLRTLRGRYALFTALPYGQYIVFGTLVMMLWRTPVIALLQAG